MARRRVRDLGRPGREALRERIGELEGQRVELVARVSELALLCEQLQHDREQWRHTQQLLEGSCDYYADLFNFAPIPQLRLDPFGLVTEASMTASRFLGRERSLLVGSSLATFVVLGDRVKWLEHLRRCRAGEERVVTELAFETRTGSVPAEVISEPQPGKPSVLRAVIVDRAERLAVEAERNRLQQESLVLHAQAESRREADAAKDRFIGMLSHELRTPLSPILAAVKVLQLDGELSGGVQAYLSVIRRNAEAEARLVDDLLDVTRMLSGGFPIEHASVDLRVLVQNAQSDFAELARQRGIDLHCDLRADRHDVKGDPLRLKQVLDNLLGNALKFTAEGGRVAVTSDNPRLDWVRLEVADSGAGLSREEIERLFQPFEQTAVGRRAREGLGLGLAISRGIIEAHGGQIRAYSSGADRGARFAFELELAPRASSARAVRSRPAPQANDRSPRVLIVEDHPDTGRTLCRLLQRYGYRVRLVSTLERAVEEAGEGCDIVISDLSLPDGSGHSLPGRLPRALPAIAVSGYGTHDDVQRSRDSGFLEHLMKPIAAERLVEAIERALGESRGTLPDRATH
jgi:signal transduction histidine kinase/ActR/RegA family two-component response regulator